MVQPPDFVAKAVDVAISELIAVATPGEGMNRALLGGKTCLLTACSEACGLHILSDGG